LATDVSIEYEPRKAFVEFHQRDNRFAAMVVHRRGGKTVACIHELVVRASYTKKKKAKYAYIGPFRKQAKDIAWEYLKDATEQIRIGAPRESDLRVKLLNGSTIEIYGADNPNSIRGLFFDGVVMDEYGDCRPSLWGEIILPTLMDRRGWAVFIGTMRGKNHFFKILERAKKEESWYYMKLKASESGILNEDDLIEARAEMTEAQYQQEMECNENATVAGTYYSGIIATMEKEGKMGHFPYDPQELVYVSSDLGFSDSTAMWFWQLMPEGPRIIDYEEHDGKKLQFYFDMLEEKGYDYACIWLPHDAKADTLSTDRTTVEQFLDWKNSLKKSFPVKVVPRLARQHGIDAARMIMPRCVFNIKECYDGVESLRAYRRSFNEKTQQFSNEPLHDWAADGADSFRYFALVTELEPLAVPVTETEDLDIMPEWKLNELFAERENRDWRSDIIRL